LLEIELSQVLEFAAAAENTIERVSSWQNKLEEMARNEVGCAKKTSCVI
jgi:hypothetical protein